jgi:hypothetical protein
MRRGFGILGLVVTAIVLVLVGAVAYNIGWQDGVNTHLPAGAATDGGPYFYHYGYGPGFGPFGAIFGLFWFLLILFGIFWLIRLAFWGGFGRRMWMGGGGSGYGGGWGPGRSFEDRAQEWHRRQHGEQPQQPPSPSGSTPPPPPSDTRPV